jgi:hypothetical protein
MARDEKLVEGEAGRQLSENPQSSGILLFKLCPQKIISLNAHPGSGCQCLVIPQVPCMLVHARR